ncbi:MAG TPA: toxic anion resistance protein [Epulopiscium sp.]|nr:toxic anion resistance protein [Candidatus Epulonipiscium sp.]
MSNEIPTLTFEPFSQGETIKENIQINNETILSKETSLSVEEEKVVNEFAEKIDLNKSNQILEYGVGAQKKIADFSETALNNVRTKDLGEIGEMLSGIATQLKSFELEEEEKGFLGFFKKSSNKLTAMKSQYDKAEVNINKICSVLENNQIQLLKDIAMLDKMYDLNKIYFKELSMYILAGKRKLEKVRKEEFPILVEKSSKSGLPEDAQAVNDLAGICNRFEKKIHDLELTRMISIQMAPQIRLIQGNDTIMAEKIQSTIVNTIPLWKSQMVLALGVTHSTQAAKAQREVTDITNQLLRKNAETLKMATIETAKESERGIIDIETIRITNESLLSTLDEVMQIQADGRLQRAEAEIELNRIEEQLKSKLLAVRTT